MTTPTPAAASAPTATTATPTATTVVPTVTTAAAPTFKFRPSIWLLLLLLLLS